MNINNNTTTTFSSYTLVFTHIMSKEVKSYLINTSNPQVYAQNIRYCEIILNLQDAGQDLNYLGEYQLNIYGNGTELVFTGIAILEGIEECEPFTEYISPNEVNENYIYVQDCDNPPGPTPTPTPLPPVCPPSLTGDCPTYITRYSPSNSLYFKNTGTTASLLTDFDSCAPVQIAIDESRMFMVDGCSTYYQFEYTISPDGCFNKTLIDTWKIWESSGTTPNASYSLALYDENTLIVGESAQYVGQTGSTLYLYDLITSGLTKWLEIGNGAQVYNVYYNSGNTQTVLTYGSASGGTGYYQLYIGATNPQLLAEIPITISIAGSTMYFSGNTAVSVNVAGLQFPLDFNNGTMYLLENQSGIPIYYVNFGDGFDYLSSIAKPQSCYTFDLYG